VIETPEERDRRRARVAAIRAEVAEEEAEAAELEAAENDAALNVALHLRIDRNLDQRLRDRAAADQIPVSALVRRLLRQATQPTGPAVNERLQRLEDAVFAHDGQRPR
jgi:hypothetical protein